MTSRRHILFAIDRGVLTVAYAPARISTGGHITVLGSVPGFISFASADLTLRAQRQSLIAANVANADTPGYLAKDIHFGKALTQAMQTGDAAHAKPEFLKNFPVGLDGNDVSLTAEKLESIRNTGAMQSEVTYLHQATTDLITALRPNPNGI